MFAAAYVFDLFIIIIQVKLFSFCTFHSRQWAGRIETILNFDLDLKNKGQIKSIYNYFVTWVFVLISFVSYLFSIINCILLVNLWNNKIFIFSQTLFMVLFYKAMATYILKSTDRAKEGLPQTRVARVTKTQLKYNTVHHTLVVEGQIGLEIFQ